MLSLGTPVVNMAVVGVTVRALFHRESVHANTAV